MNRAIFCAGLALSVYATPALADKGWIVSLGGAYVVPEEADLKSSTDPASIDFSAGGGVIGAVGYDYDPVRAEIELSYRWFDVDSVTETSSPGEETQGTKGDVDITGLFLNGYFDLNLVDWVKPYVGAGIGAVYVRANDITIPGRTGTVDDSAIAPGGQLMVGLAVPLLDNIEVAAGYRLMYLGDVTGAVTGGSAAGDKDITNILLHNFEIVLRYRF